MATSANDNDAMRAPGSQSRTLEPEPARALVARLAWQYQQRDNIDLFSSARARAKVAVWRRARARARPHTQVHKTAAHCRHAPQ